MIKGLAAFRSDQTLCVRFGRVPDAVSPGSATHGEAVLAVADDGPGFPPGVDVLARGESGGGSSGLGHRSIK